MKSILRRSVFAAACLGVVAALISCSGLLPGDPYHVRFIWFGSEEETNAIRQLLAKFEREHPGYRVTLQPVEWTKYNEKVMTMLLGGRAPDLARMSVQWCSRYNSLDALCDIGAWISPEELSDFVPSRLTSCRQGEKLFGLPQSSVGLMVFYNKRLFASAEIQAPTSPQTTWSWDEFSRAARRLQEKTGVRYGWGMYRGWFPFLTFIYQNGGHLLRDGEPDFACAANVEALRWVVEQYRSGIAPQSSWSRSGDAAETLFLRGDCGMVVTGNWRLITYSRQIRDFEWDVTFLPRQRRRATNIGGENLVVFNTPRAKEATLLARFLTRSEQMEFFCTQTLFLPTRQSLLERNLGYRMAGDMLSKFALQARDFEPQWANEQSTAQFARIESVFLKEIELAVLGLQTPEQSLERLNQEYRSVRIE